MQFPPLFQVAIPHGVAHFRKYARAQVADSVHQSAGANCHHRERQLFQTDENLEIVAERCKTLGHESEIVDSMFHADKCRRFVADLFHRVQRHVDRGTTRNVINHPGSVVLICDRQVILNQTPLRWANVVGRHDEQRIGTGFCSMQRELFGFSQRL